MIDYELYEENDYIKPQHKVKKPKTKKADHKHEYVMQKFSTNWLTYTKNICKICGREK